MPRAFPGARLRIAGQRSRYLCGLGDPQASLSPHLHSRQETGAALREAVVSVREFRAVRLAEPYGREVLIPSRAKRFVDCSSKSHLSAINGRFQGLIVFIAVTVHFQFRISGRSSPFLSMYSLCSMSLSLSCCFK